ncbi:MAG: hypothetical protein EP330_27065 [Deltaproteobacteria bacterium]|nr:MAG: hypothetical protein EP330_27065 [Deltaproteobacteria bacterium]
MRILVGPGIVVALALATGCTYVTQSDLEAKKACIDVDGDGAPQEFGGASCDVDDLGSIGLLTRDPDCDDNSADRGPHLPEVPYDGIDNDCDPNQEDLIDVDGDGYAGITVSEYEQLGGTWPPGMPTEFDCNDDDREIFPGSDYEVDYDGVDSDCDGASDYDVDGDGFVPTLNPNTGLPHDPPYTGLLETGDCDDTDALVNPDRPLAEDIPYDGIDTNCDCVNDFDRDGDGFMWDEANNLTAFNNFVSDYRCDLSTAVWDDCDDNDDQKYPDAPDTWYDGIDSNCDGADDYDQDEDGYVLSNDCVDTNPDIHPNALELVGDQVDQDCNGIDDTSDFAFAQADWVNPRKPIVTWSGQHYMMVAAADEWTDNSTTQPLNQVYPGLLMYFDPGATNASEFTKQNWNAFGSTDPLNTVLDVAADPTNDRLYVGYSMIRESNGYENLYLALRYLEWNSTTGSYNAVSPNFQSSIYAPTGSGLEEPLDLEIQTNDTGDLIYAAACATGYLVYNGGAWINGSYTTVRGANTTSLGGTACTLLPQDPGTDTVLFVEHPDLDTTTTEPAGPYPYYLKTGSNQLWEPADRSATSWPWDGFELAVVNENNGVTAFYDDVAGGSYVRVDGTDYPIFTGIVVRDIEAAVDPNGDLYVVAITEDQGSDGLDDLFMLYGDPTNLTSVEIPMEGAATLEPYGASIYADSERVFVGMSMHDTDTNAPADDVAWMFLGLAP